MGFGGLESQDFPYLASKSHQVMLKDCSWGPPRSSAKSTAAVALDFFHLQKIACDSKESHQDPSSHENIMAEIEREREREIETKQDLTISNL